MMIFKQLYLSCLAHASYFIASNGEAAVVDPQRDVDAYIEEAERTGVRIKYVIETHLHADFVSGHRELAERTGAEIVISARAAAEFPHRAVREGDDLWVGHVRLEAIDTPGHTPESVCWLATDTTDPDAPKKLLTGDTLFIGDVGRPDLAGSRGYTAEAMAGFLYESIHHRLLVLDDSVEVYPAHGAGSQCGRNISSERASTIGQQRRTNYALQPMPKADFVQLMTSGLSAPPAYFSHAAVMNRRGARPLDEIVAPRMTAQDVSKAVASGARLLDVRDAATFGASSITGAINIGLEGQFASWAGTLLSRDDQVVIVAGNEADANEATMRLARVGFENVIGYVDEAASWTGAGLPTGGIEQISVEELHDRLATGSRLQIVDVRTPSEYESGHVPSAVNVPLPELEQHLRSFDPEQPLAVICAGGYRSSAAASLVRRVHPRNLFNVRGGTAAWVKAGFETEQRKKSDPGAAPVSTSLPGRR